MYLRITHTSTLVTKLSTSLAILDASQKNGDSSESREGQGIVLTWSMAFSPEKVSSSSGAICSGLSHHLSFFCSQNPLLLGNTASRVIGIKCGCWGPNYSITLACASGSHAIGEAMGMIVDGQADAMLAGGTKATITPLCFAGFCAMKAMNTNFNDNQMAASRPFDKDHGRFIMSKGVDVVLLESSA